MSTADQPDIACRKCGYRAAKIVKMTVAYETTFEMETRQSMHRHASTTYAVKCPECSHAFSVTIAAVHD